MLGRNSFLERAGFYQDAAFSSPKPITAESTGSDETVAIIHEWLEKTQPSLYMQDARLPTRLINVSALLDNGVTQVEDAAVIRDRGIQHVQYIALSHCWGTKEFLCLKRNNYHQIKRGLFVLDDKTLPKTFMEAILMAAKLSVDYIWIDSLCIIQDDIDDWRAEVPLMTLVYRNAFCTFASAASDSAFGSLFRQQSLLVNNPCLASVEVTETGMNITKLNGNVPLFILPQSFWNSGMPSELTDSTWNSRAWCFQERILSQRIVYFGETQLYLEAKNESNERTITPEFDWRPNFFEDHVTRSMDIAYSADQWMEYVSQYSRRELTKGSDKLVAIAGVASFMRHLPGQDPPPAYIAGLWFDNIVTELLWYVDLGRTKRPKEWQAPSWSWAAVNGAIWNDSMVPLPYETRTSKYTTSGLKLIGIRVPRNGFPSTFHKSSSLPGEMLAVSRGTQLIISGRLQKGRWARTNEQFYLGFNQIAVQFHQAQHLDGDIDLEAICHTERIPPIGNQADIGPAVLDLLDMQGREVGWMVPDTEAELPTELYCLQVNIVPVDQEAADDPLVPCMTRGLVLTPINDHTEVNIPCYARIGYFELARRRADRIRKNLFQTVHFQKKRVFRLNQYQVHNDPDGFFDHCEEIDIARVN